MGGGQRIRVMLNRSLTGSRKPKVPWYKDINGTLLQSKEQPEPLVKARDTMNYLMNYFSVNS